MAAFMALGIVVGPLSSLAAVAFVEIVAALNEWLLVSPRSRIMAGDASWLALATIGVPALGGLVVGLLHTQIPEGRPHGPPDVIRAAHVADARLPLRSGLLSALSSIVSLGAGASVGQYGPLAHLGATLGSTLARVGHRYRWMASIGVGCGVASAISTAFNAPIAGIVFAHEVILRHYSLRAFAPITVASTMGYVVANVVLERRPLFRVESASVGYAPEFAGFVLIGIGGALLATVYMRALLLSGQAAGRLPLPAPIKPAIAGALLGIAALWLPEILGIGKESFRFAVIEHAFTPAELALLMSAKLAATALCIGFGFAGGVFSPALLIGLLFGALCGVGAEAVLGADRSEIAIYAICGMVAVTSPVIGAPLSSILIVFEITRDYDLAIAAMVSVVFANLIAYRAFGRSLFDVQLARRGFDLSLGREQLILDARTIEVYVSDAYTALEPDTPLEKARSSLLAAGRHEGHVLDADGVYLGLVTLAGIDARLDAGGSPALPVSLLASDEGLSLTAGTSVRAAMKHLEGFVGESIPVLEDGGTRRLLGVVPESGIIRAYLDTTSEIRREEQAAG